MATPTISGLTEFNSVRNKVGNIHVDVDSGLVPVKMPLTSSDNAVGVNILGKGVQMSIDGEYHGTVAEVAAFLQEYLTWADKNQLLLETVELKDFNDGFSTWKVKPIRMEYDHNLKLPNHCPYKIYLFRSGI